MPTSRFSTVALPIVLTFVCVIEIFTRLPTPYSKDFNLLRLGSSKPSSSGMTPAASVEATLAARKQLSLQRSTEVMLEPTTTPPCTEFAVGRSMTC